MAEKHKHYDLIVAWASGKEIEYKPWPEAKWLHTPCPTWEGGGAYRIKPEPKPDIVRYRGVDKEIYLTGSSGMFEVALPAPGWKQYEKITYDGETGRVKSIELLENK